MAGFWMAPRELAEWLADGRLSPSEYLLLHIVCESGADRPAGLTTTNRQLAAMLDVSERWVRELLVRLRDGAKLLEFGDHTGRSRFVIRTTPELAALRGVGDAPRNNLGTTSEQPRNWTSEVTSEVPAPANAAIPHEQTAGEGSNLGSLARAET